MQDNGNANHYCHNNALFFFFVAGLRVIILTGCRGMIILLDIFGIIILNVRTVRDNRYNLLTIL